MADVFISYAREDRARAEQVALGLQALGLEAFWDTDIPPGQTWADYIEGKLTGCKAVVVLSSEHSTKSQWVREEARMGRDKVEAHSGSDRWLTNAVRLRRSASREPRGVAR